MLEDIRNHSAVPTAQENEWMEARPLATLARVAVLGLVAAVIMAAIPAMDAPAPVVAVAAPK
jgi:hypothetical protein